MKMSSKEVFQSPKAGCLFAFVTRPSTKFDTEGKYKVSLVLDPKGNEEHRKFLVQLKVLLADAAAAAKIPFKNLPWHKHLRQEDKSDTGLYEVTFKSQYAPKVFDAVGNKINGDLNVGNGSEVRIAYKWAPYEGFGGGITLYFQAIQIIKLVEYAGGEASDYGFAEEQGWNVEERFKEVSSPVESAEDEFGTPVSGQVSGPPRDGPLRDEDLPFD
jgi:hypothetical protein